jgi:hypothetical protein
MPPFVNCVSLRGIFSSVTLSATPALQANLGRRADESREQ